MEYGDIWKLFKQRKEEHDKYYFERRNKEIADFFKETAKECGFDVSNVKVQGYYVAYTVKIDGKDCDSIIDFEHIHYHTDDKFMYQDYIRRNLENIQAKNRLKGEKKQDQAIFKLYGAVQDFGDAHSEICQVIWNIYGSLCVRLPDSDKQLIDKARKNVEKGLKKLLDYLDETKTDAEKAAEKAVTEK